MSTAASSTTEPPQSENEHTGRLEGAEGTTTSMDRRLGCWLICAGLIALASAAILVYERLQIYVAVVLDLPEHRPGCRGGLHHVAVV